MGVEGGKREAGGVSGPRLPGGIVSGNEQNLNLGVSPEKWGKEEREGKK